MKKTIRFMVVMAAMLAFVSATTAIAASEFYVVKSAQGHLSVVDKKPAEAASIVKGPFTTHKDAEQAMKSADSVKKPAAPTTPAGR